MAVRSALGTPEGKTLMAILDKKFYDVDTIPSGAVDGTALSLIMAVNEGQRRVVKWLKHQLEKDMTNDGSRAGSDTGEREWY